MDRHRCCPPVRLVVEAFDPPFSSFDRVESSFGSNPAVHRCFSLARSFLARTLVNEDISPVGLLADENKEIAGLFPAFQPGTIKRLSFWRRPFRRGRDLQRMRAADLIGYAILKYDAVPGLCEGWHVFEAVFPKYESRHNCVPQEHDYRLCVGETRLHLTGVLYAQQNSLNKACAQVALRSLLSRHAASGDVSNAEINKAARGVGGTGFRPQNGLSVQQIRAVLKRFGANYRDVDYEEAEIKDPKVRTSQPYQKYLYSGIESGYGSLLGFSMSGPQAAASNHIIPFYGHTFNKDTWAPEADIAYFNIGGGVGYIPSENWTSSFIGHDDNFGPNFCIPRLYVRPQQVSYVVELLPTGAAYNGMIAEARALQFIYSLYPYLDKQNPWSRRLAEVADPDVQRVILRAICVGKDVYIKHLLGTRDWSGQEENPALVKALPALLPKLLWVVEVSVPHLFAANERKLGEIVLNASHVSVGKTKAGTGVDFSLFLLARLPSQFFFLKSHSSAGPDFSTIPSALVSHVPVLVLK